MRQIRIQLKWNNPFKEPPEGMDEVLFDEIVDEDDFRNNSLFERHPVFEEWGIGKGYGIHWSLVENPRQRPAWTQERRRKTRRRNLRKRLEKQHPLFADQLYKRELEQSPKYFAGEQVMKDNL